MYQISIRNTSKWREKKWQIHFRLLFLTRTDARIDGGFARAVGARPSRPADALAALARAVIRAGAYRAVRVVAGEVVALAKLAADHLQTWQ